MRHARRFASVASSIKLTLRSSTVSSIKQTITVLTTTLAFLVTPPSIEQVLAASSTLQTALSTQKQAPQTSWQEFKNNQLAISMPENYVDARLDNGHTVIYNPNPSHPDGFETSLVAGYFGEDPRRDVTVVMNQMLNLMPANVYRLIGCSNITTVNSYITKACVLEHSGNAVVSRQRLYIIQDRYHFYALTYSASINTYDQLEPMFIESARSFRGLL